MASILSRSVAAPIREHIGESDRGKGQHAAGLATPCITGSLPISHRRSGVASHLAVSQPCDALAEPAGYMRTQEDTKKIDLEHRRSRADTTGQERTRPRAGSGP